MRERITSDEIFIGEKIDLPNRPWNSRTKVAKAQRSSGTSCVFTEMLGIAGNPRLPIEQLVSNKRTPRRVNLRKFQWTVQRTALAAVSGRPACIRRRFNILRPRVSRAVTFRHTSIYYTDFYSPSVPRGIRRALARTRVTRARVALYNRSLIKYN